MLIRVTNRCNENCTHCMVDSTPLSPHMEWGTFLKAVSFANKFKVKAILLSGGDPFLHPEIFKMIRYINDNLKFPHMIAIASNGWWIEDEKMKSRIQKVLDNDQVHSIQISTHRKYYPNYEWTVKHKDDYLNMGCHFESDWQGEGSNGDQVSSNLIYAGRARNIMTEDDIKGVPECLNYVSYALSAPTLGIDSTKQLIDYAMSRYHICTPVIDVDGKIKLSENCHCPAIWDLMDGLPDSREFLKLCQSFIPCNACKSLKNLSDQLAAGLDLNRVSLGLDHYFINEVLRLNGGHLRCVR